MSSSTENRSSLWREMLISSNLVTKPNSGHFRALSILFLCPILFTLIVYPSFHLSLFRPDYDFTISTQLSLSNFEIIALIICTLFLVLFYLCTVATFTYSTIQASYGRPINVVSSIKSIRNSFFPLLSTFIISHTILISITLIFALVLSRLIELKYYLINHLIIFAIILLIPILIWLQVNWSLAYVVAVVESKKGYESLRRSAYLVKGMGSIALSMVLFYGLVMGCSLGGCSMYLVAMGTAKGEQWRFLKVILLQIFQSSAVGYMMMNQHLVGKAVLYMYCYDLKMGDDEFVNEYVSLNMV
ncbi:hypothetical protein EJD97_005353 [Solanum chilense]|uniref:Uncharacterized protein n=1 Tax=Solanum chilense TaxID=4083 RepID=A0A6N2AS22_SOLCI|nr:hypothetical protein EJD97_005353 [Solanum chilense]